MRARRTSLAAIAVVAAVTTSGLLTACGASPSPAAGHGTPSASTSTPAGSGTPTPTQSPSGGTGGSTGGGSGSGGTSGGSSGGGSGAPVSFNGTGGTMLTISNGTSKVVMNGTVVDFGVVVRDLAWSADGRRAAFIDGDGNLDTANADGSGRVVLAHNPGGQTWSHPAWQDIRNDPGYSNKPVDRIFFVAGSGSGARLMEVPAAGGTPALLGLGQMCCTGPGLPQSGNTWVNGGGTHGTTVYENTDNGEVYIRDDYLRQQGEALTNGSEPALNPADQDAGIVFVRSVGGHDHVFVEHAGSGSVSYVDITPHATTDYTEPAVSPDGRTVAVRTPDGVAVLPIDGSAAPRQISSVAGLPAYR
ncbi:hypothetical protein DN069_18905 [Streptacidiphilus pinicola]|uniref:WD40 repeat domain-containing protein n=1 Tax=Streptacidiphilus pinicola TaxID=2219663 RepID=A0A2X0IHR0_9ACTN|nr:PD40 domain-containing protein [Streptacidiphilus pinicola]RAG84107.1 hypothetical protein DN069_18905 [Streptacidiphilus pinicola]